MATIIKILRITAQLLLLVTAITLLSGLLSVKSFLLPWFGGFNAYYWHVVFLPLIFIPLVYVHSLMGILLFFARNQKFNKTYLKVSAVVLWSALFILFVFVYVAENETPNSAEKATFVAGTASGKLLDSLEIARHNSIADCWMIVSGKVYNVSGYAIAHPGGETAITSFCGKDGTIAFETKGGNGSHSPNAEQLLASFYLGELGGSVSAATIKNVQTATQQNISNGGEREWEDD